MSKVEQLLAGEVEGLSSYHADVLRAALSSAEPVPKIAAAQKDVAMHMQGHLETLATNDLLRIMQANDADGRIDYTKARLCMSKCGKWPAAANQKVEAFMSAIIARLVQQAGKRHNGLSVWEFVLFLHSYDLTKNRPAVMRVSFPHLTLAPLEKQLMVV